LSDSRAKSGRQVKFLQTDGDGIFGRSKSFQEIKTQQNFIHLQPAAYDHDQNGLIHRECRTLLEGASTSIAQSGAPPTFWAEAARHFIFTRNNIPRVESIQDRKKIFISPENALMGRVDPFSLKRLVAFGTQVTCYIDHRS
jgi:hypothetical protein